MFSLAKRLEIYPSYKTIQMLDATITSSSSGAAFIHSSSYKAESTNSYPLNDDRKLVNQLGVTYLVPLDSPPYWLRIHQNQLLPPLPASLSLTPMQALPLSLPSARGVAALASN